MMAIDQVPMSSLEWLLDGEEPAVRHRALRELLGRPPDDAEVSVAREAAMRTGPIAAILAAQDPAGWWARPGSGYLPKWWSTSTVRTGPVDG